MDRDGRTVSCYTSVCVNLQNLYDKLRNPREPQRPECGRCGLNRDKFIQVRRFSSSENFVCTEGQELVLYAFINFKPV